MIKKLLVLVIFGVFSSGVVMAQSVSEIKQRIATLEGEIKVLNGSKEQNPKTCRREGNRNNQKEVCYDESEITAGITTAKETIKKTEADISRVKAEEKAVETAKQNLKEAGCKESSERNEPTSCPDFRIKVLQAEANISYETRTHRGSTTNVTLQNLNSQLTQANNNLLKFNDLKQLAADNSVESEIIEKEGNLKVAREELRLACKANPTDPECEGFEDIVDPKEESANAADPTLSVLSDEELKAKKAELNCDSLVIGEATVKDCEAIETELKKREIEAAKTPAEKAAEAEKAANLREREKAAKCGTDDADKEECAQIQKEKEVAEAEAKAANTQTSKELAEAQQKLQGYTSNFDISVLSVGNEKNLVIGGANNNSNNILARVINVMGRLFGTIAVLMFVIGAFFMITSQGDDNRLQKGKTILLYTIIGLLIGFTAYMMVQFVINILFQT